MQQVPLNHGFVAFVDDADYPAVLKFKWHVERNGSKVYARTNRTRMHRIILGITDGAVRVDHIDNNGLNNCRSNLRPASASQNGANREQLKKRGNHTSRYKGVSWIKKLSKWRAGIVVNRVGKWIGAFSNEVDAARAYDSAALKAWGEFAQLNFPEEHIAGSIIRSRV